MQVHCHYQQWAFSVWLMFGSFDPVGVLSLHNLAVEWRHHRLIVFARQVDLIALFASIFGPSSFASQCPAVVLYASIHSLCSMQVCIVCMCSTSWCSVHAWASMFVCSYVMGCTKAFMIWGMLLCIHNELKTYNANYSYILCKCFTALYRVSQKSD